MKRMLIKQAITKVKCKLGWHKGNYIQLPYNPNELMQSTTSIVRCANCKSTWLMHTGLFTETWVDEGNHYDGLFRKLDEYMKIYPNNYRDKFDGYIYEIYDTGSPFGGWKVDLNTL